MVKEQDEGYFPQVPDHWGWWISQLMMEWKTTKPVVFSLGSSSVRGQVLWKSAVYSTTVTLLHSSSFHLWRSDIVLNFREVFISFYFLKDFVNLFLFIQTSLPFLLQQKNWGWVGPSHNDILSFESLQSAEGTVNKLLKLKSVQFQCGCSMFLFNFWYKWWYVIIYDMFVIYEELYNRTLHSCEKEQYTVKNKEILR